MRLITRRGARRLAVFAALLAVGLGWCYLTMIRMPGKSFAGPLPPLTDAQAALAEAMREDVERLAGRFAHRNVFHPETLARAADALAQRLRDAGYEVQRQEYPCGEVTVANLIVERAGAARGDEIIVVGAHYDSVAGSPAANDNGSGVAAALALARMFRDAAPARTIRFVLFVNEEPPHFQTPRMGSWVYARQCRARDEQIVAMLSLETIGYYSDEPGSQKYPPPIGLVYPSTGNFIGFVGNVGSRKLVRRSVRSFRQHAQFPSEGGALPGWMPGVGWSDHWAFWQEGYPAIMITDTAPFRYPHYHGVEDTPEKLDYQRMARVVEGVRAVVEDLAGADP